MTESGYSGTRGEMIGRGGRWLSEWSLRILLIAGALWILDIVISKAWVVVLPVLLAVVVSTVLWPVSGWLQRHRLPPAVAAITTVVASFAVLGGVVALIVPSILDQVGPLADSATEGVRKVQDWLTGPPLNIKPEQIDEAVTAVTNKFQSSATTVAHGVFTGVSTAGSVVISLLLVVVLVFFFIKDGPKFLPWMHRSTGGPVSGHLEEVLTRMWATLGGFIRTQAVVAFIDALFIGIGLLILGVPLAGVLAVITFFGGFIPIVGAFVAGALAVLIALVASGLTKALIVLALIVLVQQIEGNVLSPILQSKSLDLHPVVVLLAVTAGGSLWGIIGAFLAVPLAAVVAVLIRYLGEQVDKRAVSSPTGHGDSETASSGSPPAPGSDDATSNSTAADDADASRREGQGTSPHGEPGDVAGNGGGDGDSGPAQSGRPAPPE